MKPWFKPTPISENLTDAGGKGPTGFQGNVQLAGEVEEDTTVSHETPLTNGS